MKTTQILGTYIQAWNTVEAAPRLALLQQCFSEHGTYIDPHVPQELRNLGEMDAMISTFRSRLQHRLLLVSEPETHHHVFRFRWELNLDGSVLSRGTFVGTLGENGLIANVIGFLDT